jgi:hypothetical protein
LWSLPAFARTLGFTVAAHPADRLYVVACGFGIVSLLLGCVEQCVVATALLVNHASRVFPAVNRPKTFAGSAVFPMGLATPIDRGCAAGDASAQKHGEHYEARSIPTDGILFRHAIILLLAPSSATPLEKQGKIARTWDRKENPHCEPNPEHMVEPRS